MRTAWALGELSVLQCTADLFHRQFRGQGVRMDVAADDRFARLYRDSFTTFHMLTTNSMSIY